METILLRKIPPAGVAPNGIASSVLLTDILDDDDAAPHIDWAIVKHRLGLSGQQIAIARLLCQGWKAAAMARPLKISINTVKTHLRRLFKKCDVHDRASFVALVYPTGHTPRE